jgi:hypothetical protein
METHLQVGAHLRVVEVMRSPQGRRRRQRPAGDGHAAAAAAAMLCERHECSAEPPLQRLGARSLITILAALPKKAASAAVGSWVERLVTQTQRVITAAQPSARAGIAEGAKQSLLIASTAKGGRGSV